MLILVKSVMNLLDINNDNKIKITDFEGSFKWDNLQAKQYELDESVLALYEKDYTKDIYLDLYNGKRFFDYCKLPSLLKILLREEAWFVISVDDYKIDVGYDYYIHIDTSQDLIKKANLIPDGIYLEKF